MHGRLKVKTTEEQEEAKRIERLKKQKLYQAATAKIFAKRAAGEYDVEALKLTSGVLSKNPDVYTLWNYRKEIFDFLQKSVSSDELLAMFSDELTFLEECLKYNPKSYGSWEHRCYVMTHTPKPDWERELSLCNAFLSYDERNFHCWDYRRFIIKQSNVKPEDELKFTFEKIASNFSNYSSWHYRSKLLPQLFSAETNHSSGLQQSTLLEEMELVQNAFFTDPNDQSAWFYHRWLLGRVENSLELLNVDELPDKSLMVLTFSMPVKVIGTTSSSSVDLPFNWFSPSDEVFSPVWCSLTGDKCTSVKVKHKLQEYQFTLTDVVDAQARSMKLYFRHELTATTTDLLMQELDSCQQLFLLEPDNKWVLLTIIWLMKSIDPIKFKNEIMSNLKQLEDVDSLRRNYYSDLRSKFIWEEVITELSTPQVDMSGQHLTRCYNAHLLYAVTELNLSNNDLINADGLNHLQKLVTLILSNNKIVCCRGLINMPCLEHLDLQNNCIKSKTDLERVQQTCSALQELLTDGNPLDTLN